MESYCFSMSLQYFVVKLLLKSSCFQLASRNVCHVSFETFLVLQWSLYPIISLLSYFNVYSVAELSVDERPLRWNQLMNSHFQMFVCNHKWALGIVRRTWGQISSFWKRKQKLRSLWWDYSREMTEKKKKCFIFIISPKA